MAKLMVEGTATISGTDYTLRDTARAAMSKVEVGADSYSNYNSSQQSTTGTTKITNCEKTITVHGGPVVVFASVPVYQSGGTGGVYLYVDGTNVGGMIYTSNTTAKQSYSAMKVLDDIPAGTHTFALYFKPQSASYTAYVTNYTNSCICVFELPTTDDNVDYVTVPKDSTVAALTSALNRIETLGQFYYPVGSIYMSVNDVDPSVLFGGTWQKIEDRMLLGSGTKYTLGNTGGNADVVSANYIGINGAPYGGLYGGTGQGNYSARCVVVDATHQNTWGSIQTFDSAGMNLMPPYLVVNIWYRVA